MQEKCIVCQSKDLVPSVVRKNMPVMQNVVYDSPAIAKQCPSGNMTLTTCQQCGHTFNCLFDPSLVVYDKSYNNIVPSEVMDRYYDQIADYLYQQYNLRKGSLVEVGCGKGVLLKRISAKYTDVSGLGIDPSFEGNPGPFIESKLRFIADIFRPEHLDSDPSLIVCRHVLEHIFNLPQFLRDIRSTLHSWLPVPFFFEVRDLNWIVNNRAFMDFCFEQPNYFTPDSVRECFRLNGFIVDRIRPAFGDQYLWVEGYISPDEPAANNKRNPAIGLMTRHLLDYFPKEQDNLNHIRSFLRQKKQEKRHTVVWGMSTKGILFNYLIDPGSTLVDQCVDINEDKQGKFLPITGKLIQAPRDISIMSPNPVIIVMNPAYKAEIIALCKAYKLEADFYDMD